MSWSWGPDAKPHALWCTEWQAPSDDCPCSPRLSAPLPPRRDDTADTDREGDTT